MPTAKKQKSGNWRCRVYSYTDLDGKKHYESFTARTKREAERDALQFLSDQKTRRAEDISVADAIDRYITSKTGVLSPATIHGYRAMQRVNYKEIGKRSIYNLNTEDMQIFISGRVKSGLSAKSVKNVYGLLYASIGMFRPDVVFRVSLPKIVYERKSAPSNEDIQTLFSQANGHLKLCIALAAFGSLRRGEICALQYGDIHGNTVYVHADMVIHEGGGFEYKEIPKTSDSVRFVSMPPEVLKLVGNGHKTDFIIPMTPSAVSCAFRKLRDRLGIKIRFHDLRHYYASVGAVLGVPDTYLSEFGGWRRGSSVLKQVYQNTFSQASHDFSQKMVDYFEQEIMGRDDEDV